MTASSIVIILKEKHSLVNTETIAKRSDIFYAIAFKGWSTFSDKRSKFSNFGILRLIIAFEKKSFSSITTSSSFVSLSSSSVSFILSEIVPYLTGKTQQFSRNTCFQLCAFHLNL